jgi:precorrin-6Y C5,15-methyltransferase (decarboxylating)
MIARNAAALGVPELRIVPGAAPEALKDLPPPNAIFIGGGIGAAGLLTEAWASLPPGGRLVANVVTTQGEARLLDWHARDGGALTRIAVSRAEPVGPHHLWRPLATVTQLAAVKPG